MIRKANFIISTDATPRRPGSRRRLARGRRWLFLGITLASSLGAALVIAEIAVRCFSREGTTLFIKDPIVGQRYQPGFSGDRFVPEAQRQIRLNFNREGFRNPNVAKAKPLHLQRVAVLGDSFVASVAVAEADTMVRRLEQRLNRHRQAAPHAATTADQTSWQVLNFGVSGFGTSQELLVWRVYGRTYHPDTVILCFFNGNDLADNSPALSQAHRPVFVLDQQGELTLQEMSETRAGFSRWLAEYSQLYVWQKNKWRGLRDRLRGGVGVAPPGTVIFDSDPTGPVAAAWQVTERLLETLAREVQEHGARLIVVQIPAHEQVFAERWEALLPRLGSAAARYRATYPEDRLGQCCARLGVTHVSLLDVCKAGAQTAALYYPEGHWNERGNALAAEAIAEALHRTELARQARASDAPAR